MSYYDLTEHQQKEMNVDYDFVAALENNPQSWGIDDVERVLAVVEGENDGASWYWIVRLKTLMFVYFTGGCDYSGWD